MFLDLIYLNFMIGQIRSLSAMEVNIVRPFVARALQAFQKLGNMVPDPDSVPNTRPQEADRAARGRVSFLKENTFLIFFQCSY